MRISVALKFAFEPAVGTAIFLGIVVITALIQFVVIDPQALLMAAAYTLGYLFLALSLKLSLSAIFGVFVKRPSGALPRGAMLQVALLLFAGGMFLLAPLLSEYAM